MNLVWAKHAYITMIIVFPGENPPWRTKKNWEKRQMESHNIF